MASVVYYDMSNDDLAIKAERITGDIAIVSSPGGGVTIADSANDATAAQWRSGFINCTGGGADTWTLPTGAALADEFPADTPALGYSWTTWLLNDSGANLTIEAGASGSTLRPSVVVIPDTEICKFEFVFTGVTGGSETYVVFASFQAAEQIQLTMPIASSRQALSGPGTASVTTCLTDWTTTGADALTLPDGVVVGQMKTIRMAADGGNGTLTITSPESAGRNVVTFSEIGQSATWYWDGSVWKEMNITAGDTTVLSNPGFA
jgi:hypothetical protein